MRSLKRSWIRFLNGDITPLYPLPRNLANLEAAIGRLFPATLLARLVSIEIEHRRQSKIG